MRGSESKVGRAPNRSDALLWDMSVPFESHGDAGLKAAALGRYRASGVHAVSLTIARDGQDTEQSMRQLLLERAALLALPQEIVLASSSDDVLAARLSGRLAVTFNFQGTDPFCQGLHTVEPYWKLGVRHALLTYNSRNAVGFGCHDTTDGPLTSYGTCLVQEMNRVGISVDLAHTGQRTAMDAIAVSHQPVIVSHALAHAVHPHPRNVSDTLIRAVAQSGGVIGASGTGLFLGDLQASTEAFVRHIDHMVQLVGAEHVAIGLDFNYDAVAAIRRAREQPSIYPDAGYANTSMQIIEPERLAELPGRLADLGYRATDIDAILGLNWLRIAAKNWNPGLPSIGASLGTVPRADFYESDIP